jgi:hypothetical protein
LFLNYLVPWGSGKSRYEWIQKPNDHCAPIKKNQECQVKQLSGKAAA